MSGREGRVGLPEAPRLDPVEPEDPGQRDPGREALHPVRTGPGQGSLDEVRASTRSWSRSFPYVSPSAGRPTRAVRVPRLPGLTRGEQGITGELLSRDRTRVRRGVPPRRRQPRRSTRSMRPGQRAHQPGRRYRPRARRPSLAGHGRSGGLRQEAARPSGPAWSRSRARDPGAVPAPHGVAGTPSLPPDRPLEGRLRCRPRLLLGPSGRPGSGWATTDRGLLPRSPRRTPGAVPCTSICHGGAVGDEGRQGAWHNPHGLSTERLVEVTGLSLLQPERAATWRYERVLGTRDDDAPPDTMRRG